MKEIKKILLATDFSDVSGNARDMAVWLRDRLQATLEVVHVYDQRLLEMPAPYFFMPGVDQWLDRKFEDLKTQGKNALNDLCVALGNCPGHFIEGRPGHEIVALADKIKADLIVLGTHGHTGWDRLVLGSVAEHVVRHTTVGVLTVKPGQTA